MEKIVDVLKVDNNIETHSLGQTVRGIVISLRVLGDGSVASTTYDVRRGCGRDPKNCAIYQRYNACTGEGNDAVVGESSDGRRTEISRNGTIWCGQTESAIENLKIAGYTGE